MRDGILFVNGRFRTLDPAFPSAEALAAAGGRIVALGRADDLRAAFSRFQQVDLGGRCALPGFVDSHIHLAPFGITLRRVDLTAARTLREAVATVDAAVRRERRGTWVLGRGWDKNVWPEDRFPTAADLDGISPDNPVAMNSKDGHLLWVNSVALRLAAISSRTPDPPGGVVARDDRGEPTGVLKEAAAKDLIWKVVPPVDAETVERGIHDATAVLHRLGITSAHSFIGTEAYEGPTAFAVLQRLAARNELRLRVWATLPLAALDHAAATGLRTGFGGAWLRVGPVKVFADGTLGSQTASMLEPFDGQPAHTGIAIHSRDELLSIVRRVVAAGCWCAIHAIGDRANRWVLDAYEANQDASQQLGARHRIEHVQLLHPEDLPRLARLRVIASMQPIHATSDRDIADRYWGRRSRYAYAWRSLRTAGTLLAFGSDAPVETPDVFQGLYAAVTRRRPAEPDAPSWYPEETLAIDEALQAYTTGPAYAAGLESVAGSLAAGKLADFVVLDRDIARVPPDELLQARTVATVADGRLVYASEDFAG